MLQKRVTICPLLRHVTVPWSDLRQVSVAWSTCISFVTFTHPDKANWRNEMLFVRDTGVVPSNTVLHRGSGLPMGTADLGVGTPVHSNAAYHQIIWPFLFLSPKSWLLILPFHGIRRLSCSRHWSKAVQPVPKAVHYSSFCYKHTTACLLTRHSQTCHC